MTLGNVVRDDTAMAKLRRYPSAVAMSLGAEEVPEAVYRTLVAEVRQGLPTLHRYFRLRQKLPSLRSQKKNRLKKLSMKLRKLLRSQLLRFSPGAAPLCGEDGRASIPSACAVAACAARRRTMASSWSVNRRALRLATSRTAWS